MNRKAWPKVAWLCPVNFHPRCGKKQPQAASRMLTEGKELVSGWQNSSMGVACFALSGAEAGEQVVGKPSFLPGHRVSGNGQENLGAWPLSSGSPQLCHLSRGSQPFLLSEPPVRTPCEEVPMGDAGSCTVFLSTKKGVFTLAADSVVTF